MKSISSDGNHSQFHVKTTSECMLVLARMKASMMSAGDLYRLAERLLSRSENSVVMDGIIQYFGDSVDEIDYSHIKLSDEI